MNDLGRNSVLKQESCVRIPHLPFASNTTAGELCNLVYWFLPRDREINCASSQTAVVDLQY